LEILEMPGPSLSWLSRPAILRTLVSQMRLAWRLAREPHVPLSTKTFLLLPALYVLSPIDVLSDFLPLIGQLDDLGVLFLAMRLFVNLCPAAAVVFHREALALGRRFSPMPPSDVVIDAQWRRG
jgi:uncharacterized membrane protein YkvA (DUF1232 family)